MQVEPGGSPSGRTRGSREQVPPTAKTATVRTSPAHSLWKLLENVFLKHEVVNRERGTQGDQEARASAGERLGCFSTSRVLVSRSNQCVAEQAGEGVVSAWGKRGQLGYLMCLSIWGSHQWTVQST